MTTCTPSIDYGFARTVAVSTAWTLRPGLVMTALTRALQHQFGLGKEKAHGLAVQLMNDLDVVFKL